MIVPYEALSCLKLANPLVFQILVDYSYSILYLKDITIGWFLLSILLNANQLFIQAYKHIN